MSAPAAAASTDFPDQLSPMVVKELRQGMRTHLFTAAFLLLQAFMMLCVLIGVSAPEGSGVATGFFWFFVTATLLIVMPARGFGALTSEIHLNTLDLIQLTRLGSWRVVFGKWAALVAQTALLASGILPYLAMRYFLGGVDLASELVSLAWILVLSMVITAVAVGFSAFRSVLLRTAVAVGMFIAFSASSQLSFFFGVSLFDPFTSGRPGKEFLWAVAAALGSAFFLIWFMLDLGASRIAPAAENHSTRKRLAALAFGCGILALPWAGLPEKGCLVVAGIAWAIAGADALTERPVHLPSVLHPFARRWWARPFALVLAPGWHTGLLFFLLCLALHALAMHLHAGFTGLTAREIQAFAGAAGAVVFPLLALHSVFRKATEPAAMFGIYLLTQACVGTAAFFVAIVASEVSLLGDAFLVFPVPLTALFAAMGGNEDPALVWSAWGFGLASILLGLVRGWPLLRENIRILGALRSGGG